MQIVKNHIISLIERKLLKFISNQKVKILIIKNRISYEKLKKLDHEWNY